jgi:hypothetical protein
MKAYYHTRNAACSTVAKRTGGNKALEFEICAARPKTASPEFQQSKDSMQSSADSPFVRTAKMKENHTVIQSGQDSNK